MSSPVSHSILLIIFGIHPITSRNVCPFMHIVPHEVHIAYSIAFEIRDFMLKHLSWYAHHCARAILQRDPKARQLQITVSVPSQCDQYVIPMESWACVPMWWSGAIRNNGNTAENGCPLAKDIVRVHLRSISQAFDGPHACIIKLGMNYCQDCAKNCVGFRDGMQPVQLLCPLDYPTITHCLVLIFSHHVYHRTVLTGLWLPYLDFPLSRYLADVSCSHTFLIRMMFAQSHDTTAPLSMTPLHIISCAHESVLLLYLQTLLLLTVHMTAYLLAHYCAAVLIPFAYASSYFTMTLILIVSPSYVPYSI